jgi:hypothetical protein
VNVVRIRTLVLLVVVASGLAGTAAAQPDTPPAPPPAVAALLQKETAARLKAADEMAGLARFCEVNADYDTARQAYAKAVAFNPQAKLAKADLARMKGKKSAPSKTAVPLIADRKAKSLAKCADLLAPVAAAYAAAERSDELAQLVALMRAQGLPVDGPLAKLEVVFYEPYLDWRRKKDVDKLQAGWEVVDGAWADPAKVAELNKAHEDWSDPWIVGDDVHEVRTTQPLRTARQVLAHVAAFRRFFLGYFTGEWDLAPPDVKLPVIVTGTRAELEERARDATHSMDGIPAQAAAFYLSGTGEGNPCFVSFEIKGFDGKTTKVDFAGLLWPLEHEVGHQIAFEYSKHAADHGRLTGDQIWAVEGVAEFLPNFRLVNGTWVLTHPRTIPLADGYIEGAFLWCRDHVGKIPPLETFAALSHTEFMTVENYHIAATLAAYLLEGKDRAYRAEFVKLLETVHQCRADAGSFAACFEGVDLKALDAEFRAYCKSVPLDAK